MKKDRVIKIDEGYYSEDSRWQSVPIERATRLSRRDADRIKRSLRRLGYQASIESDKHESRQSG